MSRLKVALVFLLVFLTLAVSAMGRRGHRRMRHLYYDGMLRQGFHIGVQGSVNSTWILNQNNYNTLNLFYIPIVRESEMDYVFTWGGQVGANIGYNILKRFGIEFHPSFSWAGQFYDDDFVGPVAAVLNNQGQYVPDPNVPNAIKYFSGDYKYINVRREVKFQYLQFPIYAKYQTHIGDIANFYIMAGPQVNYREQASENIWVNHQLYKYANELTVDQKFQKIDYGLSINTGVDIYATEWMYFNLGIVTFIAFDDLNGTALRNLDWFSKNDITYQKSHNFYMGLQGGVHFYFNRRHYY
jgi:Outer membrane protein beta-barrel domain